MILPHERRKIDQFRSGQLGVNGKSLTTISNGKRFETTHATQLDRLSQFAFDPERALGNAGVEAVT